MLVLSLLAATLVQDPAANQDQPLSNETNRSVQLQPATMEASFLKPFAVTEPNRLAATPVLDGKIEEDEWDFLSSSASDVFMQWEPGMLYLAGKAPVGQEVCYSLDLAGDGWLVGSDNVEVRLKWHNGGVVPHLRRLDASNRNMPVWTEIPAVDKILAVAGTESGSVWTHELRLASIGLPTFEAGRDLGVRTDLVPAGAKDAPDYAPRLTSLTTLRWERSAGLPSGMNWNPEYKARTVVPGDSIKIRYSFSNPGEKKFDRIDLQTEGLAKNKTKSVGMPFPKFDTKGRAFVDYETLVQPDAIQGYRILSGRLISQTGDAIRVQSSYEISDTISFEWNFPETITSSPDSQIVKGWVAIRSNTEKRVSGVLTVESPSTWTVNLNKTKNFSIYQSRGVSRVNVQFIAPQGASGLIPVTLKATTNDRTVQKTFYLNIK